MKGVAYKKVAQALRETTEKITSGKQALKLKNVGKSSGEKARTQRDENEATPCQQRRCSGVAMS